MTASPRSGTALTARRSNPEPAETPAPAGASALAEIVLQASPDAMYLLDENGGCLDLREAGGAEDRAPIPPARFGHWLPESQAEALRDLHRRVLSTGRAGVLESAIGVRGEERCLETRLVPAAGRRVLAVVRDITERHLLHRQLIEAKKMEAVGQLAGGVAHDFNNLLTVVTSSLNLISLPNGHPHQTFLNAAHQSADRAAELARRLLNLARRSPLKSGPVHLNDLVREMVGILQHVFPPGVVFELDLAPEDCVVNGDAGQLHQVLMNLCLNARDAMPGGGVLTLETGCVRTSVDALHGHPGTHGRLTVRDTGMGMPPEVRERIFEPFYTTKEHGRGTGLGLAMVQGIIGHHGGWIDCESHLGQGTSFHVHLPLAAALERPPAPPALEPAPTAEPPLCLLVDDEQLIRDLATSGLAAAGFRVLTAPDGRRGLELFHRHRGELAVVVLDLAMPGLSGLEVLHEIKRASASTKVLFSSGYITELSGASTAADAFLQKPYDRSALVRAVRGLVPTVA